MEYTSRLGANSSKVAMTRADISRWRADDPATTPAHRPRTAMVAGKHESSSVQSQFRTVLFAKIGARRSVTTVKK